MHVFYCTGDGPELRDHVIQSGCLDALLNLAQSEVPVSVCLNISYGFICILYAVNFL